jgi:hypothetical protein
MTLTESADELTPGPDCPDALPGKQERALQAVLSHRTLKEAALTAGISETTLWRYMRDETFSRRLREARREAASQALMGLQQGLGEAVKTLSEIMADGNASPSARVTAARVIIDQSRRAFETDELKARLDDLERYIVRKQEEDALDRAFEERDDEIL